MIIKVMGKRLGNWDVGEGTDRVVVCSIVGAPLWKWAVAEETE